MSTESNIEINEEQALIWGNLKDFRFPDILAYLYWARKTGVLYITRERVQKRIYIREGVPTAARSNLKSELIGEFLVSNEIITEEQQRQALALQKHSSESFGAILQEQGIITRKDLFLQARRQFLTILNSLFGLNEGFYKFKEEELPENFYYFQVAFSNLLIFGIRQISDSKTLREMVGNPDYIPVPSERFPEYAKIMFTEKELAVIKKIDGTRTIRQIMNVRSADSSLCLKTILILLHHNFIKFKIDFKDEGIEKVIDLEASATASLGFDSYHTGSAEEETAVAGDDFLAAPEINCAPHSLSPEDEGAVSLEQAAFSETGALPGPGQTPPDSPACGNRTPAPADPSPLADGDTALSLGSLMDEGGERRMGPFARAYKNQHRDKMLQDTSLDADSGQTETAEDPGEASPESAQETSGRSDWVPEMEPPQTEPYAAWEETPNPVEEPEPDSAPEEVITEQDTEVSEPAEMPDQSSFQDIPPSPFLSSDDGVFSPSEQETPTPGSRPGESPEPAPMKHDLAKKTASPAYIALLAMVVGFGIFSLSPWKATLQDRLFFALSGEGPSTVAKLPPGKPVTSTPAQVTETPGAALPVPPSPEQAAPPRTEAIPAAEDTRKEERAEVPKTPTPAADSKITEPAAPPSPAPIPVPQTAADTPSDPWKEKLAAWTERLRNTPASKYTIQIEISGNRKLIRDDLERLSTKYDAMMVGFRIKNWNAYTLLVGTFDSRQEGNEAIKDLPAYIRDQEPLVKTMQTIQKGLIPAE